MSTTEPALPRAYRRRTPPKTRVDLREERMRHGLAAGRAAVLMGVERSRLALAERRSVEPYDPNRVPRAEVQGRIAQFYGLSTTVQWPTS